jgi:hypothetical protein
MPEICGFRAALLDQCQVSGVGAAAVSTAEATAVPRAKPGNERSISLLTHHNSSLHAGAQGHPREALQIARSVLEGEYRLTPG